MQRTFTRTLGMAVLAAGLAAFSSSCVGDLNQQPDYAATADIVYRDPAQIQQVLARLYATFAVSGQQGPAGQPDITGIDEGFSNYLRQYWQMQEVTTDEAVIGWNDGNLPALNTLQWNADNEFVRATYDRIYYEIGLCNEFLRQTTDARLAERGITGTSATTVRGYRTEARFLRALSYWHAIDLFGGGPFATEANELATVPPYLNREGMFNFVENELLTLETLDASAGGLAAAHTSYARADQGAVWTLLAKLYLNARVYLPTTRTTSTSTVAVTPSVTGKSFYDLAAIYSAKVLNVSGANVYKLAQNYAGLFMADNSSVLDARNEIIFAITFDGTRTQTYGGMTYLVHAPTGRSVSASYTGIDGGWSGLRTKPTLTRLFGSTTQRNPTDPRSQMFFFQAQRPSPDTLGSFSSGPLIAKYRNINATNGQIGSNITFPDTDFPMFRLADVKLMYAEAVLRGGAPVGTLTAQGQVNEVRTRANQANVTSLTVDDILDERARELFWEGHRRTDLIRFNKYGGPVGYNWPLKGENVYFSTGKDVPLYRNLFPIPNTDRVANPNLPQNTGY